MKPLYLIFAILALTLNLKAQPVTIMLVTGGHAFDTVQFFNLFESLDQIEYEHFPQPKANQAIAKGVAKDYDVLVFYDMWESISEEEKRAYLNLTKQGKPFLFLHHSLVSYQNWDEFEKLVGGKYVSESPGVPEEDFSTYEHDVWVYMQSVKNHPITRGLEMIKLFDEVYGNTKVSEEVIPLFKTNHPKSSRFIGWENRFNSSKIIYLQPGHDSRAFESEDYRKLISRAIYYLAGKNK